MNDEQIKWLKKLKRLLNKAPPFVDCASYTIGDREIIVHNKDNEVENISMQFTGEYCQAVEECDCFTFTLNFPFNVKSTAG